ncbi:MAG: NAD(P)/FAD-dependent oxidoreductase [Coriobacteriia bacterium]|nr:NAD(P)/FAD-dependent oxidoreductase [Coriobacteriia bacterium]
MKRIVILGGGFGGYYTAKDLEKLLKPGEAEVTLIDVNGMLCYQPFLPEVAGGNIEARHVMVPLRRHLRKTRVMTAHVDAIDHANKLVTVTGRHDNSWTVPYDELVVAMGAVTKTFPTPGIADNAVGLKAMEEAVFIRNRIVQNMARACDLDPEDPVRKKILTFCVIGGGFSGMEGIAEMSDFAYRLLKDHPAIRREELQFHLVEATDRVMPELTRERSAWVVKMLEERGVKFHMSVFAQSAIDNVVKLSDGTSIECDLIVWTAGVKACPALEHSDLPLDERGRMTCNTKLQVVRDGEVVPHAWGLGDATRVEDLSGGGLPDGSCAPTAQHAVRQGHQMAKNLIAVLRGGEPSDYVHKNAGCVAGLGQWQGAFCSGAKKLTLGGPLAWLAHKGYHGFAMPSWERKFRVWGDWIGALILGRDTACTRRTERPRGFFEDFAVRPKED